jgi:hypothetical protein
MTELAGDGVSGLAGDGVCGLAAGAGQEAGGLPQRLRQPRSALLRLLGAHRRPGPHLPVLAFARSCPCTYFVSLGPGRSESKRLGFVTAADDVKEYTCQRETVNPHAHARALARAHTRMRMQGHALVALEPHRRGRGPRPHSPRVHRPLPGGGAHRRRPVPGTRSARCGARGWGQKSRPPCGRCAPRP